MQNQAGVIDFGSLLIFGSLAAGANVVGGVLLVKSGVHRLGERFLKYLVAMGAGFMLAAIFIEILPETISIWTEAAEGVAASKAVVGAMTLLLGDASFLGDDSVLRGTRNNSTISGTYTLVFSFPVLVM